MRSLYSFLFFCSLSIIIFSCGDSNAAIEDTQSTKIIDDTLVPFNFVKPALTNDSTFTIDFKNNPIEVIVKMPTTDFIGSIIVLPGWNFPNTGWCDSTELCAKALGKGYALILPQMGKSIYCDHIYPETRRDWHSYPTRKWMNDEMIPFIQDNYVLLMEEQNNYTLGLSTGARGATLLALDHPELFNACAALSGDYDQSAFPSDNLYIGYYGRMNQFEDRWKYNDNIIALIDNLSVPMYIGHGSKDKMVDIKHSDIFVEAMKKKELEYIYHIDSAAGHTYSYWNSEVDPVLNYFGNH